MEEPFSVLLVRIQKIFVTNLLSYVLLIFFEVISPMEAMIERCAGLDVHQETVVACVLFGPLDKKPKTSIETFSTTTTGLLALSDWLATFRYPML